MTPGRMEVGKQAVTWRTESPFAPVRDPREAQEHPIREGPQRCPAPRGPRCGWNPLADTGRQLIPGSSVSMGLRDSGKGTAQWQREAPAIPPAQECSRRGLFWCQQHRLGSQPSNFVLAAFSQKCPTRGCRTRDINTHKQAPSAHRTGTRVLRACPCRHRDHNMLSDSPSSPPGDQSPFLQVTQSCSRTAATGSGAACRWTSSRVVATKSAPWRWSGCCWDTPASRVSGRGSAISAQLHLAQTRPSWEQTKQRPACSGHHTVGLCPPHTTVRARPPQPQLAPGLWGAGCSA